MTLPGPDTPRVRQPNLSSDKPDTTEPYPLNRQIVAAGIMASLIETEYHPDDCPALAVVLTDRLIAALAMAPDELRAAFDLVEAQMTQDKPPSKQRGQH